MYLSGGGGSPNVVATSEPSSRTLPTSDLGLEIAKLEALLNGGGSATGP